MSHNRSISPTSSLFTGHFTAPFALKEKHLGRKSEVSEMTPAFQWRPRKRVSLEESPIYVHEEEKGAVPISPISLGGANSYTLQGLGSLEWQ